MRAIYFEDTFYFVTRKNVIVILPAKSSKIAMFQYTK